MKKEKNNELMINFFGHSGYIYFLTDAMMAKDAFREYENACAMAGINIDNMRPSSAWLRDENGVDIDRIVFNQY